MSNDSSRNPKNKRRTSGKTPSDRSIGEDKEERTPREPGKSRGKGKRPDTSPAGRLERWRKKTINDDKPQRGRDTEKPVSKRPSSASTGKKKRPAPQGKNRATHSVKQPRTASQQQTLGHEIRINKYIAHAGFCSRRDADEYVEAGKVTVNGKPVREPGTKVKPTDQVVVDGQTLQLEPFVYILLNKKSGVITTTDDERDRDTVMHTIEAATGYRVYPVGRLDRATSGLLLLTNDGDLAHRLMHPSFKVIKTYQVTPNRTLTDEELQALRVGVELEDGLAVPKRVDRDALNAGKIFITVFEGRNRLIRRMVEHIGAHVEKLKRVYYAGLNDKELRKGRWRYLRQDEVNNLRKLVKLNTLDFNKQDA
ncbi:MAG: pseudouridine synthase [Balneolaceae bacterium]